MTILQIFNRYQKPGGEEASVLRVADTLSQRHKVVRCYFDSSEWVGRGGLLEYVRQALLMIRNPESLRRVRDEIDAHQPDLILLHNLFPVCSAAVLWHVLRSGIPVVQYIHNFRPFSVNGYCWAGNGLCAQGLRKNFIPEILNGAWQESRLRTAWYALILWGLHLSGAYRGISHWLAISGFMKEKFVEAGIEADRITVLHHSWNASGEVASQDAPAGEPPYLLFLGRLSYEKGVGTLLEAWHLWLKGGGHGRLVIGGEGPLEDEVRNAASQLSGVEFRGFVTGEEKRKLLHGARAIVVPSRWWEPLGIIVYEAYDHAKPVLVAASGGLTETVIDGQTGLLHRPGDAVQLADHMRRILEDAGYAAQLGRNARGHLLATTNPDAWLERIDSVLHKVAGQRTEGGGQRTEGRQADEALVRAKHDASEWGSEIGESVFQSPTARCFSEPAREEKKPENQGTDSFAPTETPLFRNTETPKLRISVYLADQNPGHDRSFGISRMTQVVLEALLKTGGVRLETISSETSQQAPAGTHTAHVLPWGTRRKWLRLLTDHFHPLFHRGNETPDVHYFPKGYLPLLHHSCRPSVVTIHDTIIQYDEDHYPRWRKRRDYAYWARILKHTLRHADYILTVSENSKSQIKNFMERHGIPRNDITVTYEPCVYEGLPQPDGPAKENYVIHLASCEPHKRTAHLIRWWHEAEREGRQLSTLHLIGSVPPEVEPLLTTARTIVKRPFLDDSALQAAYLHARALILPSEIEGFGLPALEAYYLGTPVCYVKGTSVEEVLSVATDKGGFALESADTLFAALDEVMAMSPEEVRECGLKLRDTYAAEKVAERMLAVFAMVKNER